MASRAWRRASLRWPITPNQWDDLQKELDAIYRVLRDLQLNGGGGGGGVSAADLTNLDADNLTSGTVPAERMPALTGDITSSVGTVATTLAASGVTAGTYGDAANIPQITVDAKGRITDATEVTFGGSVNAASVYNSTAQTLTHNTAAALTFDSEDYDDGSMHEGVTNPTRLTCPTGGDGIYTVKGRVAFGTGFQGTVELAVLVNGSVAAPPETVLGLDVSSGTEYHGITADVLLSATDYIELQVTVLLAAGSGTIDTVAGTGKTSLQAVQAAPMVGSGAAQFVRSDGSTPLTADWDVGGFVLQNLIDPTDDQDAATKAYVDTHGGGLAVPNLLTSTKASSDTPDAEFSGTISPFSAIDGSSGTVSLLAGSGAGVYDVATRDGWVLMQVGTASGDGVELKQDYTLPDGNCIVAALSFAIDYAATPTNNEIWLGIGVNDNDTGPFSGTSGQTAAVLVDTDASNTVPNRVIGWDGSGNIGNVATGTGAGAWRDTFFFRIDRSGLNYDLFWSTDGFSWIYIGRKTMSSAANNIWLFAQCNATMANRIVVGCPWVRQGTALAVDPWSL